jgi:methylthioribose-1-phosphate isomerase
MPVETLKWSGDSLVILDQRLLPVKEEYVALKTVEQVCEAIRTLAVRGAPAIGVAAGYGVVLAAREKSVITFIRESIVKLRKTRPTAVNLFYALSSSNSAGSSYPNASSSVFSIICRA